MICAICGFTHENSIQFSKHVHSVHNLTSQQYYDTHVLHSTTPICTVCNQKPRKFKSILFGYFPCCSEKCSKSTAEYKQKISDMRKRTSKTAVIAYKNTCLTKYNCASVFETADFKKKAALTKVINHNDEHYNNRSHAQNTCILKYGAKTYAESNEGKERQREYMRNNPTAYKFGSERFKQDMLHKYGVENAMQSDAIRNTAFSNAAHKLNKIERKMHEFLTNRNINFVYNYSINGKNFDFAIFDNNSELQMLIEIDGEYWHGLTSDSDGKHVRGETDYERFSKVPDKVKFVVCDSSNIEECFKEILKIYNTDYEEWINNIFNNLPKEFPYPEYSNTRLINDFKHLNEYEYRKNSYVGISIVKQFHHSIYTAHTNKNKSPIECWQDKELLKKCVKNRIIYKSNLSSHSIAEGFNVCGIAKTVSVFNPIFAKYIIQKYATEYNEVFDPFSGFSGRMLGTCVCNKKYIGQDINETHVNESNEIIRKFNLNATVIQKDIFNSTGSYECLFTCSPYNLKEVWNADETDKSCDEWIDECLNRFKCKKYIFVVDKTEKYKDNIVEEIRNKSHFSNSKEYIIVVTRH